MPVYFITPKKLIPLLYTQRQKLQASDPGANNFFGETCSISNDGNTIISGSRGNSSNQGAAYVYVKNGGSWIQQQKLTASDGAASDTFGYSVDISADGNTAIVGARNENVSSSDFGAAYIFTRTGVTWSEQQKLEASDQEDDDNFGRSVAISSDGNTVVIGAPLEDASGTSSGAAYVFTRTGGSPIWQEQQKLTASDPEAQDQFGFSVSINEDGEIILIGAYLEDGAGTDRGAAYAFKKSGGTWSEEQKLVSSTPLDNARFGVSVSLSIDGNTALVGAYQESTGGTNAGAAYVFTRSGSPSGTWTETQKLISSDIDTNDHFGRSVSISGDGSRLVLGARQEDTGGSPDAGAAYIFLKTSGSPVWQEHTQLIASDAQAGDWFGLEVSMNYTGSIVVVGASREDTPASNTGAIYVFKEPS